MKKRILAVLIAAIMILTCTATVYADTLGEVETTIYADESTEDSAVDTIVNANETTEDLIEETEEQDSAEVSTVYTEETTVSETEETSETSNVEEPSKVEENPDVSGETSSAKDEDVNIEPQFSEVEFFVKYIEKAVEYCYNFVKYFTDQSKATELSGTYFFGEDVDLGPIKVGKGGLTMIIADGVTVTCDASKAGNYAGIKTAWEDRALVITAGAIQNEDGTFPEIKGTGKLIAKGGEHCAGIGCNLGDGFDAHQITIESCNVYAYGGIGGAGIGGSEDGVLKDLTINGGYVEAHGGKYAAGIGSGGYVKSDASHDITINGGTVIAYGGENAAGIGGGYDSDAYGITINENIDGISTYVESYGGYGAAGIGGSDGNGMSPHGYNITITGGTVKAYGSAKKDDSNKGGAGIGSGARQKSWGITISGGDVTAIGGGSAAGIGGGSEGEGYDITISGGTINAISGGDGNGAGIGSGRGNSAKRITISGGDITAISNGNGAGIGAGEKGEVKKDSYGIQITGGYIVATSNGNGAGLGAGSEKKADGITINGGTIVATSKGSGAGIGGGYKGEGKNITINDGFITAESKDGGAGIGGGYKGKANLININGGLITALGSTKESKKGYGLGQGGDGSQERIYVKTNVVSYYSDNKTDWTQYIAKSGDLTKDDDWNKLNHSGFKTKTAETPSITLGTQLGSPAYGTSSESMYSVTTSYVSGETWSYNWYANAQGTVSCAQPAGITTSENASSCKIINGKSTPAGTWYFTLTCGGITSNVVEYKVAKLEATITSGSASKVYDGTPLTCETYEVSGFIAGEGVNVTCTGSQTEVGISQNTLTYTAKKGTNLNNYNISGNSGQLAVVDTPFVVTGENYTGLYDGNEHKFSVKVTGKNGKDLTSDSSIVYSTSHDDIDWGDWESDAPTIKDAGTLYVKAKGTYNSVEFTSSKYTMTVNGRNIILTSGSAQREYDGTALTSTDVEISGDGFVGDEGFDNEPTATGTVTKVGAVKNNIGDDYTFNSNTKSTNYKITKDEGTLEVIPKSAVITITTPSATKTYDGGFIYAGTSSYTDGVLAAGDTLTINLSRVGENAVKDAGTYDNGIDSYKVKNGSGEDVTNCYTFAEPVIGQITINRRAVTLTSGSDLKVYQTAGDYAYNDSVTVSEGELVTGEDLSYSGFQMVDEVSYTPTDNTFEYAAATDSAFQEGNYEITVKTGYLMLVDQMAISASDQTFKYDGTSHEAPATVADNGQGAQVEVKYSTSTDNKTWSSYSTTVPTIKDAGTLYIKAKATKGAQVSEASYKATVNPRNVTIATDSATKEYDGKALTDSNYAFSQDGFAGTEGVTVTVTGTQTDVGSSKNTFKYEFNSNTKAANYNIKCEYGTLTVRKNASVIEIVSGSDSWVYNGMPLSCHYYTATWKGEEVEDGKLYEEDVLTVTPIGSITDVGTTSNEFKYQVIRGGNVDVTEFYTFECTEGMLEVTPRSVVINTASAEKVYDGTALTKDSYTVTGDGFISGEGFETVNIVGSRLNAGTVENVLDEDTPYTFNTATKAENYDVSVVAGTLKVNKRKVSVASGSAISTIGNVPTSGLTNSTVSVSADGFVTGEVTVTADGCRLATDGIGESENTLAYSWSGNGNPANYAITETLGILKIVADGAAGVVATGYTGVYDGKSHGGSVATTLEDANVYYSTDGKQVDDDSKEWLPEAPEMKDVKKNASSGEVEAYKVDVKVTKGADTAYCSYTITITPRDLVITAGSATKVYDGTPLTCNDYIIGGDGYAGEESAEIVIGTMSGNELVDVGTDKNLVTEVNEKDGFKRINYSISSFEGTLEITKRPVIIISKALGLTPENVVAPETVETAEAELLVNAYEYAILSDSPIGEVVYDGREHSQEAVLEVGNPTHGGLKKIDNMGFVGDQGLDYSVFTTVADAGVYRNEFQYSIKDGTKPENCTIKKMSGVIKITPRKITLSSGSAQKKYDGTALTNGTIYETTTEAGDAFVEGDGAEYIVTGTQTNVGKSDNTFTYTLKADTKEINYDITIEEGTLEVYSNDTLRVVVPENQVYTYDGKPHGDEAKAYIGDQPCSEKIWYSVDDGFSYVDEAPQLTDVGTQKVLVKVSKNGYTTAEGEYTITIKASDSMSIVISENQTFTYDGKPHGDPVKVYIGEELCTDATVTYSTDGGNTWSSDVPQLTNAGTLNVIVKAEKAGYETVQKSYTITVKASSVTPGTGDANNTLLYIIMIIAAVAAATTATLYRKRKNQ